MASRWAIASLDGASARALTLDVSREIARNGGAKLYRAAKADKRAWQSALRPKPCKLAMHADCGKRSAKLALMVSPADRRLAEVRGSGNEASQCRTRPSIEASMCRPAAF